MATNQAFYNDQGLRTTINSIMYDSSPVFVYLGANAHDELEQELRKLDNKIHFVESAIYPEGFGRQNSTSDRDCFVTQFDVEMRGKHGKLLFTKIADCNNIPVIDSVMDDKMIPLLWTRFARQMRWQNRIETKRYEVVYSLTKAAIQTCQKYRPKFVVFSYEPHMLPVYIFKQVCRAMGLPVFTMVISPFIWRMFLRQENAKLSPLPFTVQQKPSSALDGSVKLYINEKQSKYTVAKPFYEKRFKKSNFAKLLLFRLKANAWRPDQTVLQQILLWNYQRLTTSRKINNQTAYVCMFLQLQPEQSTLPDAGLFVHQLLAIQMLYSAASELNMALIIREHPATFENAYSATWRPLNYYKVIHEIGPNIYFNDLESDPYLLIKNAKVVSAITGTVLLEAQLNGKPAIAFGKHPLIDYSSLAFVDRFANEKELVNKLTIALEQSGESIICDTEEYLRKSIYQSFGPNEYRGNSTMSLESLRHCRYEALRQVVRGLLQSSFN